MAGDLASCTLVHCWSHPAVDSNSAITPHIQVFVAHHAKPIPPFATDRKNKCSGGGRKPGWKR
eukprot:3004342-Prorocentrum_lima.AAC.1